MMLKSLVNILDNKLIEVYINNDVVYRGFTSKLKTDFNAGDPKGKLEVAGLCTTLTYMNSSDIMYKVKCR